MRNNYIYIHTYLLQWVFPGFLHLDCSGTKAGNGLNILPGSPKAWHSLGNFSGYLLGPVVPNSPPCARHSSPHAPAVGSSWNPSPIASALLNAKVREEKNSSWRGGGGRKCQWQQKKKSPNDLALKTHKTCILHRSTCSGQGAHQAVHDSWGVTADLRDALPRLPMHQANTSLSPAATKCWSAMGLKPKSGDVWYSVSICLECVL